MQKQGVCSHVAPKDKNFKLLTLNVILPIQNQHLLGGQRFVATAMCQSKSVSRYAFATVRRYVLYSPCISFGPCNFTLACSMAFIVASAAQVQVF